ncbi:MAG: hypothetical protein WAN76_20180 [Candidatus Sulfotelmatobacter sp.]
MVTDRGGPQYTVRHGSSGYVARNFDEFVSFTAKLMSQPGLLSAMRVAAREQALTTSWDRIFEGCMKFMSAAFLVSPSPATVFWT